MQLRRLYEAVDDHFQDRLAAWLQAGLKPPQTPLFRWHIDVEPGAERQQTPDLVGSELATPISERDAAVTVKMTMEPAQRLPEQVLVLAQDWSWLHFKVWAAFDRSGFKAAVLEEGAYGDTALIGAPEHKKHDYGFSVIADIQPVPITVKDLIGKLTERMVEWADDLVESIRDDKWVATMLGHQERVNAVRDLDKPEEPPADAGEFGLGGDWWK